MSLTSIADTALRLDGRALADEVLADVAQRSRMLAGQGVAPGLAVVLVGENPASQVYVRAKSKTALACGFHSLQHTLPADATHADVLALVAALNADPAIHGILVQLPLPPQIDAQAILEAVAPHKDVDGFHPFNAGLIAAGDFARGFTPCTPAGSMRLIARAATLLDRPIAGMTALVVGRSTIVGRPMAQLLLCADCTVTIAHSRSRDLPSLVAHADILVAAIGRAEAIAGAWVKPGAIVIDVGINRVPGEGHDATGRAKTRLVGDIAFAAAALRAGAITPVPGGVGPMTIAMLMANTVQAAQRAFV